MGWGIDAKHIWLMTKPNFQKAWGARIKQLRKARGLTQEELAAAAHLSDDMIGSVEQGRAWTSLPNLCALADALGVELPELFNLSAGRPAGQRGQIAAASVAQLVKISETLSPKSQSAVLAIARRLQQVEAERSRR